MGRCSYLFHSRLAYSLCRYICALMLSLPSPDLTNFFAVLVSTLCVCVVAYSDLFSIYVGDLTFLLHSLIFLAFACDCVCSSHYLSYVTLCLPRTSSRCVHVITHADLTRKRCWSGAVALCKPTLIWCLMGVKQGLKRGGGLPATNLHLRSSL